MSLLNRFLAKRNTSPSGEMSFVDHIEELRWHIVRSLIAMVVGTVVAFVNIKWIYDRVILGPAHTDFIAYRWLCSLGRAMGLDSFCLEKINIDFQSNELSGQFMTALSSSMMIGFIFAFPYIFFEFWKFLKPALKENEARNARGIVFWTTFLFFVGVLFAYFIVVPFTVNFFASYQLSASIKNLFTIRNYYDMLSNMTLALGVVFELPVIVFFLSKVGILTPVLLRKQRRYAYFIIFVIAEIITPPDWFSCFLVAFPMWGLYEVGISISTRAAKERAIRRAAQEENNLP